MTLGSHRAWGISPQITHLGTLVRYEVVCSGEDGCSLGCLGGVYVLSYGPTRWGPWGVRVGWGKRKGRWPFRVMFQDE